MDSATYKRRAAAAQAFLAEILGCSDLHQEDRIFEPKNFAAWMHACDTRDQQSVRAMRDSTLNLLSYAKDSSRAGKETYIKLRTHYVNYASEALARRWPITPPIGVVDDGCPF